MQKFLKSTFPHINTPILFEDSEERMLKESYDIGFVSAFDHWLTVEECDQVTMCFAAFRENEDSSYLERENKFMRFYESLFYLDVYSWEESEDLIVLNFKKFEHKGEYLELCLNSVREKKFLNICAPSLQLIVCGGFDLTQKILIRKGKENSEFKKIVTESGLFILN